MLSQQVEEELGEGVYEVSFAEQSLGIKVANVPVKDPTTNEPTGAEEITVRTTAVGKGSEERS